MPAAAGRPLLRAVEAAGQDRPDDAGEAAHGGRVQTRGNGGTNARAQIRKVRPITQESENQMAFARAAKTNGITPGTIREFQVEGKAIALANVGGKFYAINNTCLHRGGPLGQGVMDGNKV